MTASPNSRVLRVRCWATLYPKQACPRPTLMIGQRTSKLKLETNEVAKRSMVSRPEAQTLLILRPLHASGALHPTLAIVKRPLTNNNVVPGPQSRPTNDRRQGKAARRGAAVGVGSACVHATTSSPRIYTQASLAQPRLPLLVSKALDSFFAGAVCPRKAVLAHRGRMRTLHNDCSSILPQLG